MPPRHRESWRKEDKQGREEIKFRVCERLEENSLREGERERYGKEGPQLQMPLLSPRGGREWERGWGQG
eukprot:1039922-Rhodomonas_salina.1